MPRNASKAKARTISVTDARQNFSELLTDVFKKQRRVVVEKQGIPVAAIISARDLERLEWFEEERERRFAPLIETSEAFKDVPLEEIEREVARAIAEVRAENARERRRKRTA